MDLNDISKIMGIVSASGAVFGSVFWMVMRSQFLERSTFYEKMEAIQSRLVDLEKASALTQQPIASMNSTLIEIKDMLHQSLDEHRALEGRVAKVEAQLTYNKHNNHE